MGQVTSNTQKLTPDGRVLRHWAPMTMGSDGQYGHGLTKAKCGLEIPDHSEGLRFVAHSNLEMHVTCQDCLEFASFEAPDRRDPKDVERWLSA